MVDFSAHTDFLVNVCFVMVAPMSHYLMMTHSQTSVTRMSIIRDVMLVLELSTR